MKFGVRVPPNYQKLYMALVRMLYFCVALFNIHVMMHMITHIAGTNNQIASAPSHFQATRFRQLAPLAEPLPHSICAWPTQFWSERAHEYQSLGAALSTHCTYQSGVMYCCPEFVNHVYTYL